ncbi:hypothetical protein Tco_1344347 [Tanacetum coccineum]
MLNRFKVKVLEPLGSGHKHITKHDIGPTFLTLIASSSSKSSSTKGDVLDGGGVSSNVTLMSFLNFHGHLISKETGQPALLKEVEVGSCSAVLFSNYMFSSKTSTLECDSKSFTLSDLCGLKDAEMRSELLTVS